MTVREVHMTAFGEVRVERIPDPRKHVVARKGGGKSGGGAGGITTPHQPQEQPNTLRSRAVVRIAELLSEGPVYGPEVVGNGSTIWQAVTLDGTPVADAAGNFNFALREGHFRYGLPGQSYVPGYSHSESEVSVGIKMEPFDPVVRSVELPVDAIRYKVRLPALYEQEGDGDVVQASIAYAFDVSINSGPWTNVVTERISGKTMSPYERAVHAYIPGAEGATTIDIRLERIEPDSPSGSGVANEIWFQGFTQINYDHMGYDDSCYAAMSVNAEEFQSIPQRGYLLRGLMVDLPTNYNGLTHGYSGDWNGLFYTQWTNNPAWILYALMTNRRWGLGRFLETANIDKWSFYEAGVFNDAWMTNFNEVRYTCNCVINTQQDAYTLLQAVASSMIAQLYYSNGTIFLVQDRRLTDPVRLFGPADVEHGLFDYTSSDVRSKYTAVAVTWNDPSDDYKPAVELVQDNFLVAQQGYREARQPLFGCTSRGQAIRWGRWFLYTNQFETEVVTFKTGLENADLRPGDLILINDPSRAGVRFSGRVMDGSTLGQLTVDAIPQEMLDNINAFTMYVTIGSAAEAEDVTVVALTGLTIIDGPNGIIGSSDVTGPVREGSFWLARGGGVEPTPWRVAGISDQEGKYEIIATEYHIEKFDYIEQGVLTPPPPFSLFPVGPLAAPTNLTFSEFIYRDASGAPQFGVVMSWSASSDPRVQRYQLEMSGPSGDYRRFGQIAGVAQEVLAMRQGTWTVALLAFDNIGRRSSPVYLTFIPIGLSAKPLPPSAIYLAPQGALTSVTWIPTGEIDVAYYWLKWSPLTDGTATWERATTNIARVAYNQTEVVTPTRAGTYMLKSIDALGQESDDWIEAIQLIQRTERVHVIDLEQDPDWLGDRGGIGTVWSPTDKNANVVISNGGLTMTVGPVGMQQSGRASTPISGKRFYSFVINADGNNVTGAGFASGSVSTTGYVGATNKGIAYFNGAYDGVFFNNTKILSLASAIGAVVDWAINLYTKRAWVRINGGNWNGNALYDPVSGNGGFDISTFDADVFPAYSSQGPLPGSLTANFEGPFTYAPPSGYDPVYSTEPHWHQNVDELWVPPPDEPEAVPEGVFPGDRAVALNKTPTRIAVYEFDETVDLGMVTAGVSIVSMIEAFGMFLGTVMADWTTLASVDPLAGGAGNTMSSWVPLASANPLALGASAEWDGHIEMRVAQGDMVFSEWSPVTSVIITGRAFEFRMIGSIYDLQTTMRVEHASVTLEVPLRNLQGDDVALHAVTGELTVTYPVQFLATPTVQITARQGLAPGGNIVIVESDEYHFKVQHEDDAGDPVGGGSIDYFVQGYGGHA